MKSLLEFKKVLLIVLGLFACQSFGQSDFFKSIKLEATLVVSKHEMGSDLVEMTILGADYPMDAVQEKLTALGKELGNDPRGIQTSVVTGQFVKTSFAINGLITKGTPKVNLVAIAKALAFGTKPIHSFSVFFSGVRPDNTTPARWFDPKEAWLLEGMATKAPAGIEYRITVNTKNPDDIYLPGNEGVKPAAKKDTSDGQSKLFIFGGIIVGAIAVGLLVYSALLRPRPGAR